ncbi:hypothetical protein GCM10010249_33250 [Streptomyces roseolilacinus]|uniref:Uncharacterized protein n=1 Tax=Streptomyces roseolilacinus TaxID=66904 RepID=A0A918EL75_9ACTN|nr:hypothetical protein GCM10010249_33250 [Streptomyces roseolilacinus]
MRQVRRRGLGRRHRGERGLRLVRVRLLGDARLGCLRRLLRLCRMPRSGLPGLLRLRMFGMTLYGHLGVRRYAEVTQRRRPHHGSLTGPLSHRPLHHRRDALTSRTGLVGAARAVVRPS